MENEALIVEADADVARELRSLLERSGYGVVVIATREEAMKALESRSFALMVANAPAALEDGAALIAFANQKSPKTLVSILSSDGTRGRLCFASVRNPLEATKRQPDDAPAPPSVPFLVGRSRPMRRILALLHQVAPTDATVLVTGESGTGKEVVARAIHHLGPLQRAVFLPVNCGAIPETLLEAQLFGHVKGSFTGADDTRQGFFHRAHGGTLLLDEIGELAPHLQVKLLRVIEQKEIIPIGATSPVPVKVRVIAGTNRDLRKAVAEGKFREDLYYRLNVVRIELPPLRERADDIPPLVDHMIGELNQRLGKSYKGVTSTCLEVMMAHPWPGNVRELRHAIEYAMIVGEGEWIRPGDLPAELVSEPKAQTTEAETLDEALRRFEKAYLENELRHLEGNRRDLAAKLGIDASTLYRKIQAFGIKTAAD